MCNFVALSLLTIVLNAALLVDGACKGKRLELVVYSGEVGICHLCSVLNVHCTVHICAEGNKRRVGEVMGTYRVQWGKRRVGGRGRGGAVVEAIVGAVLVRAVLSTY